MQNLSAQCLAKLTPIYFSTMLTTMTRTTQLQYSKVKYHPLDHKKWS